MKDNLEQYETSLIISCNKNDPPDFNYCSTKGDEWQEEKLQKLVSKFNENIASIWKDDDSPSQENYQTSIWSFPYFTPASSTSPSPRINIESLNCKIWQSDEGKRQVKCNRDDLSLYWEPLNNSTPIGFTLPSNQNNPIDVNNWFSYKCMDNRSQDNKTSLTNHRGDSLFVEVSSIKNNSKNEESILEIVPCVQTTPTSTTTTKSTSTLLIEKKDSVENLLTSPKTHFQPIKLDSIDNDSEETMEADAEVARLVPCSSKCPNNESKEKYSNENLMDIPIKSRPLSTSLPELASFMGPFTDIESGEEKQSFSQFSNSKNNGTNISFERATAKKLIDCLTNCTQEKIINSNNKKGLSCSNKGDEENDFEELCTLLNQVLNEEGDKEDIVTENEFAPSYVKNCSDENKEKENRLSWSCYWDTFLPESPQQKNNENGSKDNFNEKIEQLFLGTKYPPNHLSEAYTNEYPNNESLTVDIEYKNDIETNMRTENSINWLTEDGYYEYLDSAKEDNFDQLVEWSTGEDFNCNIASTRDGIDSCQVYYSCDLEEEWQKEETCSNSFNLKVNAKNDIHTNYKRPCSFFLGGNCRRSDCKFTHDLKSITCKFWEESTCFKGEFCPFLHGYPEFNGESINVDGSNPKYTIDSESDFPSLATREPALQDNFKLRGVKKDKESQILFRMVKKKRRKRGQQTHNEKVV